MNDVGHIGVLRLRCGAVRGDVEISRDLEKKKCGETHQADWHFLNTPV